MKYTSQQQLLNELANQCFNKLSRMEAFKDTYFMFSAGVSACKALEIKKLIVKYNGSICLNTMCGVNGVYMIPQSTTWKPVLSYATSKNDDEMCSSYSVNSRGHLCVKPLKRAHSTKNILALDAIYEKDRQHILKHKLYFIGEQDFLHIMELKEINSVDWYIYKGLPPKYLKNDYLFAVAPINSSQVIEYVGGINNSSQFDIDYLKRKHKKVSKKFHHNIMVET